MLEVQNSQLGRSWCSPFLMSPIADKDVIRISIHLGWDWQHGFPVPNGHGDLPKNHSPHYDFNKSCICQVTPGCASSQMTRRRHLFKDKFNGNMTSCLSSSLIQLAMFVKDLLTRLGYRVFLYGKVIHRLPLHSPS